MTAKIEEVSAVFCFCFDNDQDSAWIPKEKIMRHIAYKSKRAIDPSLYSCAVCMTCFVFFLRKILFFSTGFRLCLIYVVIDITLAPFCISTVFLFINAASYFPRCNRKQYFIN